MRYIIHCDPRLQIEAPYELIAAPEIVYLMGEINEESAALFRRDIEVAEHNALAAGQEILPVCIDTPGGCLYSLMGIIDAMEECSVKLATVVESKAMSAGAVLVTCGDRKHRYMGKNATMMLHSASGGLQGTLEEVETNAREMKRLDNLANEIMDKNCGKKKGFFTEKTKQNGPEWFISAKEAKKLGLIKHIGLPLLETNITVSHQLKMR